MGWFSRPKKFAMALALVAALSSSCKKEIPKEDYQALQARVAQVEAGLKSGQPNRGANRALVKMLLDYKKKKYMLEDLSFPRDFDKGVDLLDEFYFHHKDLWEGARYYTYPRETNHLVHLKNLLSQIKDIFGFTPEDEKQMLLDLIRKAITDTEKAEQTELQRTPPVSGGKYWIKSQRESASRAVVTMRELLREVERL